MMAVVFLFPIPNRSSPPHTLFQPIPISISNTTQSIIQYIHVSTIRDPTANSDYPSSMLDPGRLRPLDGLIIID